MHRPDTLTALVGSEARRKSRLAAIRTRAGSLEYRVRTHFADLRDARVSSLPAPASDSFEYRILFLCHGNVCRSPLAEAVMKMKLAEARILDRCDVDSAGTSVKTPGRPPHWRARDCARRRGLRLGDLKSRQLERSDFDAFDRIIALDRRVREQALQIARDAGRQACVSLPLETAGGREVDDPIDGDDSAFERAYEIIDSVCEELVAEIGARLGTPHAR